MTVMGHAPGIPRDPHIFISLFLSWPRGSAPISSTRGNARGVFYSPSLMLLIGGGGDVVDVTSSCMPPADLCINIYQ